MKKVFFAIGLLLSFAAQADYRYVECRCSVNFQTPTGDIINVSDFVYCPTSEEYNFTCYGNVIGSSLDTMCDNANGETSKSPNWSAPRGSTEVLGTLSCSL